MVLTCLGIKNFITFKKSRNSDSLINRSFLSLHQEIKSKNKIKIINYSPSGSDERQYCSLGIDLPIATFMSKKCGEYKEYHLSLDNKSIVSFEYLNDNIKLFIKLFKKIEDNFKNKKNGLIPKKNKIVKNKVIKSKYDKILPLIKVKKCEPHLSKWKIHYATKDHKIADTQTQATKWLIHFSNGKNSIEQISKMSSINSNLIYKTALKMKQSKLLVFKLS